MRADNGPTDGHSGGGTHVDASAAGEYGSGFVGRKIASAMKTLVTGATGFLGSHVARATRRARGKRSRAGAPVKRSARARRTCTRSAFTGDLRDAASLDRALEGVSARFPRGCGLPAVGARSAGDLRIECDRHAEPAGSRARARASRNSFTPARSRRSRFRAQGGLPNEADAVVARRNDRRTTSARSFRPSNARCAPRKRACRW